MSGNSSVEQELSFDSTLSSTNDSTRNDDGEAPKRPGSAYNLWAADNRRRKVKADLANLYCGPWAVDSGPWAVDRELGKRWAKVDEATYEIYNKVAQEEKAKYTLAMQNYTHLQSQEKYYDS